MGILYWLGDLKSWCLHGCEGSESLGCLNPSGAPCCKAEEGPSEQRALSAPQFTERARLHRAEDRSRSED